MPKIISTSKPVLGSGGNIGSEGKLFLFTPKAPGATYTANDFAEIAIPAGSQGADRRPGWAVYNQGGRSMSLGVGAWTSNILLDQHHRVLRQGIPPPRVVPTLTDPGGGSLQNVSIGYYRFVDLLGARAGPLSGPSAALDMSGGSGKRSWDNVPTTSQDPSVSHVQGLARVDGFTARVAWTRQLGAASPLIEEIATLALGEAAPTAFVDMPLGTMNLIYHDAQWVAGNEEHPERVFRSALGQPERWEGSYVQTDGEAVSGLFEANTNLFFGSRKKIYRAIGYEDLDIKRDIEKPDIGLLGHHGSASVHGRVIVPTSAGFFLYAGQWHYLMDDRQTEWQAQYLAYRSQYEAAQGFFDSGRNVYLFGPVQHTGILDEDGAALWTYWVIDCERLFPETEANIWTIAIANDAQTRKLIGHAVMFLPGSSALPELWAGDTEGYLYRGNQVQDDDDDGDSYTKRMVIEPSALMPAPGGTLYDGFTFHTSWIFLRSKTTPWDAEFRCGSEYARELFDTTHSETITPSVADSSGDIYEAEPQTPFVLEQSAGQAISLRISIGSPPADEVEYNGWGGTYGPGIVTRGRVDPIFKGLLWPAASALVTGYAGYNALTGEAIGKTYDYPGGVGEFNTAAYLGTTLVHISGGSGNAKVFTGGGLSVAPTLLLDTGIVLGSNRAPRILVPMGGKLWCGEAGDAYSWNGTTFALEDSISPENSWEPAMVGVLNADTLLYAYTRGSDRPDVVNWGRYYTDFRMRDSGGVWRDITALHKTGAPLTDKHRGFHCSHMIQHGTLMYLIGTHRPLGINVIHPVIYTWDGVTYGTADDLVLAHELTFYADADGFYQPRSPRKLISAADGNLYYLWDEYLGAVDDWEGRGESSQYKPWVGKYDGVTWDDNYVDIGAKVAKNVRFTLDAIVARDGKLYVLLYEDDATSPPWGLTAGYCLVRANPSAMATVPWTVLAAHGDFSTPVAIGGLSAVSEFADAQFVSGKSQILIDLLAV